MTTALDIITSSLEQIQAYAPGDTISSADYSRSLSVLNDMLDEWSNSSLLVYANLEYSKVLTPGIQTYTVGVGGDINLNRPLDIQPGYGRAYILDNMGTNYPLNIVGQDEWNSILNRLDVADVPDTLFYDPQYPLGKINLYPIPDSNIYTLYFDSGIQFTEFTSLNQSVNLPVGYSSAIRKCLAVELHPYFITSPMNPLILKAAMDAKATIKRKNKKPIVAIFDKTVAAKGSGQSYNIFTNSYSRRV